MLWGACRRLACLVALENVPQTESPLTMISMTVRKYGRLSHNTLVLSFYIDVILTVSNRQNMIFMP